MCIFRIFRKKKKPTKINGYVTPTVEMVELESANGFLAGSVTNIQISVKDVRVEEYKDGFANEGGFKDISFD